MVSVALDVVCFDTQSSVIQIVSTNYVLFNGWKGRVQGEQPFLCMYVPTINMVSQTVKGVLGSGLKPTEYRWGWC